MASVYRSEQARADVRRWCVNRIDGSSLAHARSEVMTTAGVTGVVTAGSEPVAKNARKSLSFASLYRAVAEAEATAPDDGLPLGPKPARVRRPEDPLTPEGIDLRERLQAQPHPNAGGPCE
ncbi:hypothetical protein [Streptomyces anulatus]|uniref:hypothetical protein n=1 Tax=Streptomyces anulatus TaxID=1892 RepID=UPI0036525D81